MTQAATSARSGLGSRTDFIIPLLQQVAQK